MGFDGTLIAISGTFLLIAVIAVIYDYFGQKSEKKAKKQS